MKITAALTLVLMLTAPSVRPAVAQETAATSPTRFVDIDGGRIGYRTIGSGTPLVLLTRFRGTLDTWDPRFIDRLARTYKVITVDYPSVGYSTGTFPSDLEHVADFVNAFAARIGLSRFAVLGWSWGGLAAQALLLRHPETVSHAILVGTAPPGPGQAAIQQAWLARALKPVNDLEDEEILFFEPASESSRRAAKRSHDRIYARPGVTERIPATESAFQAYFSLSDQFKTDAPGRRDQLQKSGVPLLILCGDADPSVPASNWYPLIGRMPRAQLIVLPQAGHAPQHQFPDLAAHYIDAFLREEEPQQ